MSYQALYRVWRPQRFDEVIGQKLITQTLKNAVKTKQISHAYLFAGPRGTGKTSMAKIFAKAVNCQHQEDGEPCNQCETCKAITKGTLNDVIEIDAASNNGVEEIRDIRDKVKYAPTEADYKVYIIDEVHMLSTGAFNALLKTLEEPPANVIFYSCYDGTA
jgi:DNA polymerase III, subunit gamma and tau